LNILLTGAAGQLGSELHPMLSARGHLTATDRHKPAAAAGDWLELDIGDFNRLEALLERVRPALIVNTAAYTAVDRAEADRQTAFDINAELPSRLAAWAGRNDARLLHYSTDYVFNGNIARPYLESDRPDPQNVYGESKLAGERAVAAAGCTHVTLRTSWVYSSHGKNFVLSMLDLARRGLSLSVVNDQRGCPTWARNLAHASIAVIEAWQAGGGGNVNGVYHYRDDTSLSWYGFANAVFRHAVDAGLLDALPGLAPVPSSEFPQPAKRPGWSVLDTGKIDRVFGVRPASFEHALKTVIDEIKTRA
jgi:dTDP-4-dehydrorhamnose reductase